jgi:hypothetical protein
VIYYVEAGVALERPPTVQEYRKYVVWAPSATEASLTAAQMAACTCVMPVSTEVVGDEEVGSGGG